jgi:hypothetical protein
MLDSISNFERKRVKLGQLQFSLFSSALQKPKLGVPAQIVEKNIGWPLQML